MNIEHLYNNFDVTKKVVSENREELEQHHKFIIEEITKRKRIIVDNYPTIIADDQEKIKLFIIYLLTFSIKNKKSAVGIDYEFKQKLATSKQREIALMQIAFDEDRCIWIINPAELGGVDTERLINLLMVNQSIYKILHGADSQDIPYMYNQLFNSDETLCIKFTQKLFDTKFLCEYYRVSVNQERQCKIEVAQHFFGTISDEKLEELHLIKENMGPVQDVAWDIHNLSSFHVRYALHDAIYLKKFLDGICKKISEDTPQYINTYRYIKYIIRFMILARNGILNSVEKAKEHTDPINNYMIVHNGENHTLIKIFNSVVENLVIHDGDKKIYIDLIVSVNYFRKSMLMLFKKITYFLVFTNYRVFKKRGILIQPDEKYTLDQQYSDLKRGGFEEIVNLLDLFKNEAYKKLSALYI